MSTTLSPAKSAWPKPAYHLPDWAINQPVRSDDIEVSFQTFLESVRRAQSYDEIRALMIRPMTYDQEVRSEEPATESLFRSMRQLDDAAFVAVVRQVKTDRPKWLSRPKLTEFVNHELEMRYLVAGLARRSHA